MSAWDDDLVEAVKAAQGDEQARWARHHLDEWIPGPNPNFEAPDTSFSQAEYDAASDAAEAREQRAAELALASLEWGGRA